MHLKSLVAAALLSAVAYADVVDDVKEGASGASSSVSSAVESVTSSAVQKPTFTVSKPSILDTIVDVSFRCVARLRQLAPPQTARIPY